MDTELLFFTIMINYQKILKSKCNARFNDYDPFNHLPNARYIDYFLNAREDHVAKYYDLDFYDLTMNKKIGWVVSNNQILYL